MTYASAEALLPLCKCGCGQPVKFNLRGRRFNDFVNKHGVIFSQKERRKKRLDAIPKSACKGCGVPIPSLHERGDKPRRYCSRKCYVESSRRKRTKVAWHREWMLRRKYNLTQEQYEVMLESQGGVCAICKACLPSSNATYFAVDHDHRTGKVRGLLCSNCNRGIGHLQDSPEILQRAANYIMEHSDGLE